METLSDVVSTAAFGVLVVAFVCFLFTELRFRYRTRRVRRLMRQEEEGGPTLKRIVALPDAHTTERRAWLGRMQY